MSTEISDSTGKRFLELCHLHASTLGEKALLEEDTFKAGQKLWVQAARETDNPEAIKRTNAIRARRGLPPL
jgi:uncharacterized protein YkwD